MKVLNKNEYEEIQTIFHLSDIHIRLYHRLDDEYEHVFQQMYQLLEESRQKDENEKCLIVVTGDILHHKNDLSPECILATLKFLNTLSSYYPTLFIAGNHDTLLNNLNRIDSLSAILAENHNINLHYLKYSGWYRYANVVFGVSSLLDEKLTMAKDFEHSPWKKIALYHGGVGKFSTNKGFVMEGIPMSTFDGYDMVMLGDIHLHQYLDKQKRIAYAGSMIAQNFGETDPDHGVLKWDVETGASSLIVLDNPYRYCEAVLKDGNSIFMDGKTYPIDKAPFPEKGRLKILLEQRTANEVQILTRLRNKYPSIQFHENVSMVSFKEPQEQQSSYNQPTTFLTLLQEYFATLPDDWEEKPKLMEIITSFFKDNLYTKKTCASHFEILNLEFDYMFGYGPNIKIDFSQFQKHETIGIFGMNSAGKSTLIDVMLFLLYGSITRYKHSQTVPTEVIHFQQKKSSGTIRFRSHNITYEIQKKMSRTTNGKIKVEEKLFKIHPDGTKVDFSEEHRKKTDKFVVSQIGTPTQFLFTNIFLQTNEQSFRSMTPKDRKDFLYDILELSQLEQHYQENYIKWKENKNILDQLEKELQHLYFHPEQMENVYQELSKLKNEKETYENNLSSLQKQIREKLSTKQACPLTIQEMEQQKKLIQSKLANLEKEQQILEQQKKQQVPTMQPEFLEQTRKDLWQSIELLYKKIQPLPIMDVSRFRLEGGLCSYQPTPDDVESFRQDVYDQFMAESHSLLQDDQDEEQLLAQKEKLLSSLYPEPDPTTDTHILQKELEMLQQRLVCSSNISEELVEKTDQLTVLEMELLAIETEWKIKWEEWDQLQKEPDMVRFMSGLRFNGKCRFCSHNESTLQSCLLDAEQFKQKKLRLWEAISPSKEKQSLLKQQIVDARKKILDLQQQQQVFQKITKLQQILDNRSTRKQLSKIKIQQNWFKVKQVWEQTKYVAEQRKKTQEKNEKIEKKISKKKQKVAELDHQRRLWDEWREITHELEKEETKLAELKKWEQNVEENSRIDCWVQMKEQEEQSLKTKINQNMDRYIMKQQEFNLLEQKMETRKKKETQYNEIHKEHNLLTRLLQILHRDGLPMYFLEQYLPQLESRINQLISPFLKQKKIVLRKEQKKESINILLSVSTLGSETNYLGGMEGFIVDASIKEVLAEVSLQCKSNLFIIDEGISALDKKNMENLDQFFHFLEERHPHVFIISHLSEAQHIVRHSLQISKVGDYSKIEFV